MFRFRNPIFSVGNAAYRMPTSKSGPWQKLVPIAWRLSDHVTMAATMKGTQFEVKRMTLSAEIDQVLNLQIILHTIESMIRLLTVSVVFLKSSTGHHTWPLSVPHGGGVCFGREHFSFISVGDCLICSIVAL